MGLPEDDEWSDEWDDEAYDLHDLQAISPIRPSVHPSRNAHCTCSPLHMHVVCSGTACTLLRLLSCAGAGRGRAASARALALSARCARRDRGEVARRAARGLRLPAHHDPNPNFNPNPTPNLNPNPTPTPNPNPNPTPTPNPTPNQAFVCPLTMGVMRLPAITPRGTSYEYEVRAVQCSAASKSSK